MIIIILKHGYYGMSKKIEMLKNNEVRISINGEELKENVDYALEDDKKSAVTIKYGNEPNAYQITLVPFQ